MFYFMKDYETFFKENYQHEEKKVNGILANLFGLLIFVIASLIFGFFYYRVWGHFLTKPIYIVEAILFIVAMAASFFVHEMLHGMAWSKYTEVGINVILKSLFRLCYCREIIKARHYIFGLVIPTIILGIIPILIGLCLGNFGIFVFGILGIAQGGDDFLSIYMLRSIGKDGFIKDTVSSFGFIIYTPSKIN
ncbi:MAG: hypothetical protein Ta2G_18070 [Termitinemataceae bacterium]|nr:MAG: hypothetical protein Ta2G_18070 [Termitinemataceae bacterium]